MGRRADVIVTKAAGVGSNCGGAGTNYLIPANNGSLYFVFIDNGSDVAFRKSSDGGVTWSAGVEIYSGTVSNLSVWYDRWSGINADLIHVAYTEGGTDDTRYRTIDAGSSDALSTETVIFAGASNAAGGQLSITRARGGNVYCRTCIDAGAEGGFFRLPNANVPNGAWDAARTINEALATQDQMILMPGWAADNQDIMGFFWDADANEISRQVYDDSADTWGETSIAASMVDNVATNAFPHFAAAVDLANSRNLLVAWSGVDTANADLRCWHVTEAAITEVTNVVLNSTDDQGLCAIGIDTNTGYWYVVYGGKSDGSETYFTAIQLYYKVSQDNGSTWGAETLLSTLGAMETRWMIASPRFPGSLSVAYQSTDNAETSAPDLRVNVDRALPRAALAIGV